MVVERAYEERQAEGGGSMAAGEKQQREGGGAMVAGEKQQREDGGAMAAGEKRQTEGGGSMAGNGGRTRGKGFVRLTRAGRRSLFYGPEPYHSSHLRPNIPIIWAGTAFCQPAPAPQRALSGPEEKQLKREDQPRSRVSGGRGSRANFF